MTKPRKGGLTMWKKVPFADGFYYTGIFQGHPEFNGRQGHTSMLVSQEGDEIETLNSRYTLIGEPWSGPND